MKNSDYVIVRTHSAGVFSGLLDSRNGAEVVLKNSRRIWYWSGAASLSDLAQRGTIDPDQCKFTCEVDEILLLNAIEILSVTEVAKESIDSVKIWSAHE